MEGKKISFGFTKTRRPGDARLAAAAAPVQARAEDERRDYIDCVEENAIKVVGGEEIEEKKLLIIPLQPNTLITAERLQQIASEVEGSAEVKPEQTEGTAEAPKIENETLEQQAARELLEEARNMKKVETQVLTVPIPTLPPLAGQKESTLEDYETVPITDFGMAMLRGMGWTPGKQSTYIQPALRAKGLGLGADKLVKQGAEKGGGGGVKRGEEEELKLKKGCHVRVTAGKHAGSYGKVVSLDDESGRALVELAVRRESVSISEHMLQPVSRSHYDERSRVINSEKYEEYIKKDKLANERNEKSASSKKATHISTDKSASRDTGTSRRGDNVNGQGREDSNRNVRRDSLSSEEDRSKRDSNKQRSKDGNSRGRSPSPKYDRIEPKSRNIKSGQNARRSSSGDDEHKRDFRKESRKDKSKSHSPDSEDGRRERSSRNIRAHKSRRSSSSSIDNKYKRDPRKDSKSNSDRNERNRSPNGEDDRTERRSLNESKARRSSTSSEGSRTRPKHKSKNSHRVREQSSGCESDDLDEPKRSKKSKKNKHRSGTPIGKRDIDKKRKGKKKKRDRDRSPNYRKHKK